MIIVAVSNICTKYKGKHFTPHSLRNLSWRKYWFFSLSVYLVVWCSMNIERYAQILSTLIQMIHFTEKWHSRQAAFFPCFSLWFFSSLCLPRIPCCMIFSQNSSMSWSSIQNSYTKRQKCPLCPCKHGCFWAECGMRTLLPKNPKYSFFSPNFYKAKFIQFKWMFRLCANK